MTGSSNDFLITGTNVQTQMTERSNNIAIHQNFKIFVGFKFLLCFFVIIPLCLSAHTFSSDLPAADQISQNNSHIYISGGATVIGMESIYIPDADHEIAKIRKTPTEKPAISTENLSQQSSKEKEVLTKKFPQTKPVYNFESKESTSRLAFGTERFNVTALNFNPKKLKFSSVAYFEVKLTVIINRGLDRQTFYPSISYLQFKKYLNSLLRGPPQYL